MDVHRYKGSGLLKTLIAGIFLFSPLLSEGVLAASESEQLIVFTQPDVSAVENSFRKNHLPQIRKIAQAMGVSVHEVDARKGSPGQVAMGVSALAQLPARRTYSPEGRPCFEVKFSLHNQTNPRD